MVVRRVSNGSPFATVTYTLTETDALDPAEYQARGAPVRNPRRSIPARTSPSGGRSCLTAGSAPAPAAVSRRPNWSSDPDAPRRKGPRNDRTCDTSVLLTLGFGRLAARRRPGRGQGQQPRRPDPERAFSFGDSDLDGKLSLEEFRELLTNGPRLKNATKKAMPEAAPGTAVPAARRQPRRLAHDQGISPDQRARGGGRRRAFRQEEGGRAVREGRPGQEKGGGRWCGGLRSPSHRRPRRRERPITPEQAKFFETKIRPVLMNKCAKCHSSSAEKLKGGLLVDSREGLRKGVTRDRRSCRASPMKAS